MGDAYSDPPPPQWGCSSSQDKKAGLIAKVSHLQLIHATATWQLSDQMQRLLSSSELEATAHECFSEDGRERVLLVSIPLDDLLPSKSPTLISLATLWVNVLLRKAVRMKHWSWAYVLHILNNEAANVTFDELFRESIRYSQGDMSTQVFLSVLQNELLQDNIFNFLKEFAQKCVDKGGALQLHRLKNLELTVPSCFMENSEIKLEFDSTTKGGYEQVLQACTTPDSSDEPPHLTAYLTILLDDADTSETPSGCSDGEGQPTNSPADDPPPSHREVESISKVQDWFSRLHHETSSQSFLVENDAQSQSKEKATIKQQQNNAIFRYISSSESDLEQIDCHGSTNPARPFPAVAGTSEILPNILTSRAGTMQEDSAKKLQPLGESHNIQSADAGSLTPLPSTELFLNKPCKPLLEGGMNRGKVTAAEHLAAHLKPEEYLYSKYLNASARNKSKVDGGTSTCIQSASLNSTREEAQLCLQELATTGASIRIMITGRICQGKSTLVNNLMGKAVATGRRSVTCNTESFTGCINGVKVTLIDTPGLSDLIESDQDTLPEISQEIGGEPINLILFCVRMDGKLEKDDYRIMRKLTQAFGQSIWEHTLFVLTFANNVKTDSATFAQTLKEWDKNLHEYAHNKGGVQADIVEQIPVVVAGDEEENLPGCESWLAQFWVTAINRSEDIATPTYLSLTSGWNKLANSDLNTSENEGSFMNAAHLKNGKDTIEIANVSSSTPGLDTGVPATKSCTGAPQNPPQPLQEDDSSRRLATPNSTSLCDVGEQLICSTVQASTTSYRQSSNGETDNEKLPVKSPDIQESIDTRLPETEMTLPQLWFTEILQNLDSLKTFIQFLPAEVQVLRDAVQGKTLCHALVGLDDLEGFSSADVTHLLQLLEEDFLQQCMVCQDFSGNTPLHCAIEANNASTDVVKFLLRFSTCEAVMIINNDSLTPLELSCEKKLWPITEVLIEYQIVTGASCAVELLQEYFFKVMKQQGGTDFLPRLLGLKEHYCPDLDLNFCESRSRRTPWWYLTHSNDASVIGRVLRTLKDYSIEFESLKIRSGNGKNLVEEAEAENNVLHKMIQAVNECQHSEQLLPPPSAQPTQTRSSLSAESSSLASSSEGGMTSLEADESSDGESEGVLSKAKHLTKRIHKKTIPAVQQRPITTGTKKRSNLSVVYQCSGYSGDDSDYKDICSQTKSSKFTSAQRAAAIKRKERSNKESSSEYSGAETEDCSVQIKKGTDTEPTSAVPGGIKLTFQGTSCTLQMINCLSLIIIPDSKSTELHHAVRQQYFQSVRDILACDGGEDQIQTIDEEGHTPLQIASQNKNLQIFEFLLESLISSQVSSSVTLPPCSGHHQMALLASIVKVLSKKEIDIDYSTLHWTMMSCQCWKIPRVLYATPTTVLTMALLEIELLWSYQNQLLMDTLMNSDHRTGSKKKRLMQIAQKGRAVVPSVAAATQELAVQNEQGITSDPTSSHAITDRTAEESCYKSSSMQFTHKQSETQELAAVQEQGTIFQSEMVSVTCTGDLILIRAYTNSLVTGLTLLHSQGFEFRQIRTTLGIPSHQPTQTPDTSTTAKKPNSADPTSSPATTDKRRLTHVAPDSPSYFQPKSSAAKLTPHRQVPQLPAPSLKPTNADSEQEVTIWQAWINKAVDCLHAGYYSQMLEVLKFGKVPPSLPAEISMAAQFGCALAYYKLEKYSEAAKHLESLKTTAASAQSYGNESIASVYLGDIEFTQSRYTEAAKHYSHALKLYKSDNLGKEYRLIVPTFSAISAKLGTAFRNTSKVVDAVQAYRQAIATANSRKDKLSAHTSLGNLFQSVGENASALAEYEHSIKLSEELRDYVSLGWAHGNMGNAYLGLYQRDKSLYHLEKALDLTVEHEPTPQAIGRAYNNLGTAYQALNELDKAEEKYDLALSQSIYGNDLPGQARVYGNIGNVLMLRKDYDRAVPHYTEVLRLSRDRSTVSTAFHNRGCSYYEWAESKKATLPQKAGFCLHGPDFEYCEVEHQPSFKSLPNSILKYYQLGRQDLEQVIKYHEETFKNIKGSSKGLTLSVSLFETNSRTFHRLQDCLVNLGEWEKALVVAEQSRNRTLGELLVKRKNSKIDNPLTAPLNHQSITDIVQSQHSVVVYLSYTGARLLGWVLAPTPDKVSVDMFEVPSEDDQFDGKSFDYHMRYSLTEELVERSLELYGAVDYKSDVSEPVRKLYKLVCKPLMKILKELKDPESTSGVQEMIIIPDSYTCLLPFPCLLDEEDKFLGDSYSFRIMPSLLTMGIVDQLPSVVVQVPADGRSMCVVGNPTIPSFVYNGDQWSLGKLPFATREAEWVANILKTTPILHEQATKDAILMRIMNAKVIHIATHGSASAGFLAFAGMSSARNGETVEAKNVLLYPEDIERLSISPALVVLSSCDSGRGTVKADRIIGMARAFILAGAQAVLTTLWRVPDESASVFMQFFYQYLMDGPKASLALQKATLSVRCFSKYSQYIHWSGYQLTGREIQFDITKPSTGAALEARLGKSSVFPRLEVVQQLESAFLKDLCASSDVQILRGPPGVKLSEPLIDFIHSFHHAFKGGIFWINGRRQEFVDTSAAYIRQSTATRSIALQTHPVLIVFDYIDQLPQFLTSLFELLKQPNTHIVVISKNYAHPDTLLREIDNQLLRGCNIIDVKPLSPIHTTQRIVHSILSAHHLAPTNKDQDIFERLAQFTSGSPALIDVAAALFLSQMEHDSQNESQDTHDTLVNFTNQLSLDELGLSTKSVTVARHEYPKGTAKRREISNNVYDNIVSIRDPEQYPWCTSSPYDSWQAVTMLIDQCHLSAEEKLLLFAVSMFSCSPVPMSVVTEISSMIATASRKPHISTSLHSKLFQMQLMKRYPLPVLLHPSLGVQQPSTEPELVYVPQYITRAIWKDMMSDRDKVVALTTMYMALHTLADNPGSPDIGFLAGLTFLLVEMYELNYELMGKQCYQEVYKLYLQMMPKDGSHPTPVPDTGAMRHDPTPPPDIGATPSHPTPPPDTGTTPPHLIPPPDTGATPPHPTPPPDTGATPPHPTPPPDTGATPPHPTPPPNTGATLSHSIPPPDTGAIPPHPTPPPNTGATPPHPTPPPDTGAILSHPTPPPDTGATLSHPTPPPDTGAIPPHPTPPPNTGATPPHPTPPPNTGAILFHPTPAPDTGATPPHPTPPPNTGATLSHPTPAPDTGHPTPPPNTSTTPPYPTPRCVVLIGKSGAGKSTIASQLVEHDPLSPIKLPFEDTSGPVTATHEVKQEIVEFQWENNLYRLIVIDTVGFLPAKETIENVFDKIKEYIITNIERVNLFLFVIKKGCFTAEDQKMFNTVFSLIRERLCNDFSLISALAITGCKDDSPATRERIIKTFKRNLTTRDIASQMGMGIYAVGFPDVNAMNPVLQQDYKKQVLQDRDTVRGLIDRAKSERDVKLMIAQLTTQSAAETRPCDMKPTMAQLMMLTTAKGDVVKVIKTIAPVWKTVGYLMDFDQNGETLDLIETEHAHKRNGVLTCCQEMFKLWLCREDATWKKLNELLIVSERKVLAKQVMDAVGLS